MGNQYAPDRWVLVKINHDEGIITKVLASWFGGYTGSDEWRLSSGVESIEESDTHYVIRNQSGSEYTCYKNSEGFSALSRGVFARFNKAVDESATTVMKSITIEDYLKG
jgi:hypothetical protein